MLTFQIFDAAECARILESVARQALVPALAGRRRHCTMDVNLIVRPDRWLRDAMQGAVARAATEWACKVPLAVNVDGHSVGDRSLAPRVAHYTAPHGHFGWHTDVFDPPRPVLGKTHWLTCSMPLTDEHEGGDLLVNDGQSRTAAPRSVGHVAIFPAWWLHSVTPVTRGTRRALVWWGASVGQGERSRRTLEWWGETHTSDESAPAGNLEV